MAPSLRPRQPPGGPARPDLQVVFRVEHPFPFTDDDGGTAPPHVDQPVSRAQLAAVDRCRLDGTTPALEGEVDEAG